MKKIKNWIICFSLATFIGGCNDDMLYQKPTDRLSSDDVLTDVNLIELFTNNIYQGLPNDFQCWDGMLESGSDDVEIGYGWAPVQQYNVASITPNSSTNDIDLMRYWGEFYSNIRKANIVLENIDAATGGTEETKARIKGEVKFLRAYYYFELIRIFGRVPIITKSLSLEDDLQIPRNTLEESIDFVVSEADEAASLLPLAHESENIGRATRGAALALKAKMLLYGASPLFATRTWAEAAAAAKAVMDLGVYTLPATYSDIWEVDNNSETIFDKQIDDAITSDRWSFNSSLVNEINFPPIDFGGGWGGMGPTQDLVDSYEMTDGEPITTSPLYDENDPYVNRDPRFYATIVYEGSTLGGKVVETRVGGNNGIGSYADATKTGYYMKKFLDEEVVDNVQQKPGQANFVYLRYAEVLLNYAEAQNEAVGPDASVYAAMHEVRNRAGIADLPAGLSQDQMRERIRNERRVEFALEIQRFFDIRRWKIARDLLDNKPVHGMLIELNAGIYSYTRFEIETRSFPEKFYFMPIPQSEIDKNVKLEQNPGY